MKHLSRFAEGTMRLLFITVPVWLLIYNYRVFFAVVLFIIAGYCIGWGLEYLKEKENEGGNL